MFFQQLKREILRFKSLSNNAQKLLISYFFVGMSYPLILTFVNAYIFKKHGDILTLSVYYLGYFAAVTATFFMNGFLLKKIPIKRLYFAGTLFMGISPLILVFYTHTAIYNYFIYGLIGGLGLGFHWANRNYFTQVETKSEERNYFQGFSFSADTITSVVIAFIAGWLLVLGVSYQALMFVAFIFLTAAGLFILKTHFPQPKIRQIRPKKASKNWKDIRLLQFGVGVGEGMGFFFVSLIILIYLGNEGVLGTLSSATSLLAASLIYIYGRKAKVEHRKTLMIVNLTVGIIFSLFLAVFFNNIALLLFVLTWGIVNNFFWLAVGPISMDAIDNEDDKKEDQYSYIFDMELLLNIGRATSIFIGLAIFFMWGQGISLRFAPLVLFLLQATITPKKLLNIKT